MFHWNQTALFSVLVSLALKGTLVLGVAWLITILLRRRSAASRHLVWTAAAAGLVALPVLSLTLPALRVPVDTWLTLPATLVRTTTHASPDTTVATGASAVAGSNVTAEPAQRSIDWRLLFIVAWAAGAAFVVTQMLVAFAAVWRIRRKANPLSGPNVASLAETLGVRHNVDVLEVEPGSMPMTVGIFRPAVLLPADALQWSQERRRMVLLHELAHVRRGDVTLHILARTALSFYWWNPLAWVAWSEFLKESERAADDLVLNAGEPATEYASHLLEVARTMQWSPAVAYAAVAMARRSQLEGRLLAILDSGISRNSTGRTAALATAVLAAGMVAPIAMLHAQDAQAQRTQDFDVVFRTAVSQKSPEILDEAAKAAEQMRKFDVAHRLLESAVTLRGEVSGQGSVEYGIGLLKLGDLENARGMNKEAETSYTRAAQILGDRPEAFRALISLGVAAITKKDLTRAFDYFQHAQRIDAANAGTATMWMALVRNMEQKTDEAEFLFQSAMSASAPNTRDGIVVGKVYSRFLRKLGRTAEADDLEGRMTAAQKSLSVPASSQAAPSPGVLRIGGGVTAPRLLQKVEPQYTEAARIAKLDGTVVVYVEVGPDGGAHNVRIIRGLGLGLDERAIDAISQWSFQPGYKDSQPVTVAATIEVNFRLI